MPIQVITTLDDPRLDVYRSLTDVALRSAREPETGIYIAESAKVISRAVQSGHMPISILMEHGWLERMRALLGSELMESHIDVFVGDHAHAGRNVERSDACGNSVAGWVSAWGSFNCNAPEGG